MKNSVDMPTLEEMKLGRSYKISATCGCLMFHRDRISVKLDMSYGEMTTFSQAVTQRCGGFLSWIKLAGTNAENSLSNRRKAMRAIEAAVEDMGFDVK